MRFVTIHIAYGINEANIIKSKLDSYDIPVLMKYESAGIVFALTLNGLGKVEIKVPEHMKEQAETLLDNDLEE